LITRVASKRHQDIRLYDQLRSCKAVRFAGADMHIGLFVIPAQAGSDAYQHSVAAKRCFNISDMGPRLRGDDEQNRVAQ
jgi:hypothetical protein